MFKQISLGLVVVFLVASGAQAALPRFGEKRPEPGKMVERMAKDIGLTKEQKDKFIEGAKKIEEIAKASREKDREIMDKIEAEMVKDSPDTRMIHSYLLQISQNRTEIQFKRLEQMIELRKGLTPEQKTKLEQLMKKKPEHKGGKPGQKGEPGEPPPPGGPEGPDQK
jgi:Spy/CpxP family protein refolding chaperone